MTMNTAAHQTAHNGWTPSVQDNSAEMFRIGTTFDTLVGPVPVEQLEAGDIVLDGSGAARTVVWIRETRQSAENLAYADAHSVILDDGRTRQRTRFPGIRFVRGKPADAAFQVLFRDLEESEPTFRHHGSDAGELDGDVRIAAE